MSTRTRALRARAQPDPHAAAAGAADPRRAQPAPRRAAVAHVGGGGRVVLSASTSLGPGRVVPALGGEGRVSVGAMGRVAVLGLPVGHEGARPRRAGAALEARRMMKLRPVHHRVEGLAVPRRADRLESHAQPARPAVDGGALGAVLLDPPQRGAERQSPRLRRSVTARRAPTAPCRCPAGRSACRRAGSRRTARERALAQLGGALGARRQRLRGGVRTAAKRRNRRRRARRRGRRAGSSARARRRRRSRRRR